MKYKIVVGKANKSFYFAYCPLIPDIQVCGTTAAAALDKLQEQLLCFLHDPKAEFEIVYASGLLAGEESIHEAL